MKQYSEIYKNRKKNIEHNYACQWRPMMATGKSYDFRDDFSTPLNIFIQMHKSKIVKLTISHKHNCS